VKLYGDQLIKLVDGRYSLAEPLRNFPTNLGIVEGKILDNNDIPFKGYVEIDGQTGKINDDGSFKLKNIPLGEAVIRVSSIDNGLPIHEEKIHIEVTGPTPRDIKIKR